MDKFERFSNYNEQSAYQQVIFGHDNPILETELNEMQQLQDNSRLSLIRKQVFSGFTELVQKEFKGEPIIYNPTENGLTLVNKIAIAPFRANVAGYEINGQGNFTYNKIDNYILVDLGQTSKDALNDTLVYLEVWFETAKGDTAVTKFGYIDGDVLGTPAKDNRVAEETSRRLTLCWAIRVKNECDFNSYADGMGYNDIFHYSHVFAKANGQFGNADNVNMAFCEATNDLFRAEDFHSDKNLYVGGRPTYEVKSSTLHGKYVFALPMFRIRRRNRTKYSLSNFNGSSSYNEMVVSNNSSLKGDILNDFRPDGLAYDVIDVNDVMDLRRSVNYADYNENSIADETVNLLFSNQLQTKITKKMRRVQIGNKQVPLDDIESATVFVPFEKSVLPTIGGSANAPLIAEKADVEYQDSVCGFGAVIKNDTQLVYNIRRDADNPLMNRDKGTVDFFFKPFWNGSDEEISQEILWLTDTANKPILKFEKKGLNLVLTHYNDLIGSSQAVATVDLSTELIKSHQFYHFRIAWTNKPMPINGMIYFYINGQIKAQAEIATCKLVASYLKIGGQSNTDKGFLIDSMIAYNTNFEILAMQGSEYGYAKNTFFPMLPNDFIHSDTLLLPAFNGYVNNLGDNAYTQQKVTTELFPISETSSGKTFTLSVSSDKKIKSIDKVYNYETHQLYTLANYSVVNNGNSAKIVFTTSFNSIKKIIVEFTLELNTGCGGQDIPTEILGATWVKYEDEADNYDYGLHNKAEVSFNAEGAYPRQVPLLKPRKVNGEEDKAYDISNKVRTQNQCYARLLYYNMSGNGTIEYNIPTYLYGYKVVGVIGCSDIAEINEVYRTPSDIPDEPEQYITVHLKEPLLIGETITFTLATEGESFDYDLNSKTIFTNMCQCKTLQIQTDGKTQTFTVPCMSNADEVMHGGILVSAFTFYDAQGKKHFQCYENSQVFYNEYGEVDEDKHRFNTREVKVSGFGTPFITITLDTILPAGNIIEIPIMTTYQPLKDELLSIWYNYIPYQGVMENKTQNLKRITDWKYFVTTLGTGKGNDEQIRKNIINDLPGGMAEGYIVDNNDIILKNFDTDMKSSLYDVNKKLVFPTDYALKQNAEFCNLVTDYKVRKNCSNYQDGKINFQNVDFCLYFDDCTMPIKKYVGAYCVVVTDTGELMVFVVGNFDKNATVINKLSPVYGDLYHMKGRPTTVRN